MSENALHARFRVTPAPAGDGLFGIFDTEIQGWAIATKAGDQLSLRMSLEEAVEMAAQLESERDEPGDFPELKTTDTADY